MTKRVVRAALPEELKTSVGDSSPCSPETNFRELDDVFLQNQTRIWLGEVLHIRFDEETSISDLLADGELLFQVSKVVWKKLLKKHAELKYSKVYIYERTSSFGKNNGKYMAYPKVDSFLKICQILGLTGVDLFSPSDVVEKRDVRRVCMCIRSLSKRARLKGLNVPDFEIVTYTVAMPTDLVCGIRRTLEQSHSSSSNSTGSSSSLMELREIYRQRSSSGLHIQHYDSQSESDETESSLAEFEFQSPLSITSYDDANLYSIIGENSPEENWIIHGNLSELQRQFRLDTREQNEVSHKGCIQIGNHEFMDGFRKKSYSSHTESQIDQDTRTCLDDMGEELWPLSNSRNHEDVNIVHREYCRNFTSAYEDSSYELEEPRVVDPEDALIPFHSMLWREGHHKQLPKFSLSDCDKNLDNGNELKSSLDTLAQAQTISFRQGDNGMESQNMVNYNHDVSINAKIKKGNNDAITLQMVPSNLISEVPLLGNCISDHADMRDFICHGIDDGKDSEVSNKFLLSLETVNVDQEEAKNGLERMAVDKARIDQMYSTPSLISEDMYNNSTASILTLPQVNSLREAQLFNAILESHTDEHASAVVDRVEIRKNGTDLFTTEKYGLCIGSDGMSGRSNIGSYTHDIRSDPPLYMDCQSAGCSVSTLVENNQVSHSSTDLPISDDIDSNQSRYPLSPNGRSTTGTSVEKNGISGCTCNLEMDAYEQPDKPIMSNTESTAVNSLAGVVRNTCRGIKSDGFDSEPTIGKEEMITSGTREQDSSYHLCEINKELTVEPRENGTEGLIETILHIQDSNVPQMKIPEPTCTTGRKICAEERINVQNQGLAPLIDNCTSLEPEKPEDNESMKNTEECEKELGAKPDSCGKHKERAKGNIVLKSIAGAMTLLGALFFVHHIRQKRDKENGKDTVRAHQDQNLYREVPMQKRVEVAKSTVLYPGERFKF